MKIVMIKSCFHQVLLQHDPNLLNEMGGPIRLNVTWAKSFLKRMGINKQKQVTVVDGS